MKICDFPHPSDVVGDLAGTTAQEILSELCKAVAGADTVDAQLLLATLLEREKLGSTGIGEGIAIPQGKIPGLPAVRASIGRSTAGIDFKAIDSKPAHIFIALFAPASAPGVNLQALARLSRILRARRSASP